MMKWFGLNAEFYAENFEWLNVQNGVRMQKLWPVKVGVPKLAQFELIRTLTSRNRPESALDADLTFDFDF